jgi:sugar lactone lactonase YvrE
MKVLVGLLLAMTSCVAMASTSYYPVRLEDKAAVYVTQAGWGARGDGVSDDTAALQKAIDRVADGAGEGVVFLPAGRYRITRTLHIWPGVRLIGYGAARPVLVVAPHTPNFQKAPSYMVFFAGEKPSVESGDMVEDANPGTFYSAMSNVDIEIGDGNPGAVGVRARYAQHCYLAHMDFHIGSGLAGIHDGGNVAEDVHFYGGEYGIWTRKPSPGWQFTVIDASFEGQRKAAIREQEAGLTLVRPSFKALPTAVEIDAEYADELWIVDARLEQISGAAFVISNEENARTEINMERVVCREVPLFARLRKSGRQWEAKGALYEVRSFSHGLSFDDMGAKGAIRDLFDAAPLSSDPVPVKSDLAALPSMREWSNVRELGLRGDGKTDDTEALRQAIATHRTLYFPMGQYRVTDTIRLRPDTVLIGLHPSQTRIFLADGTPAFQGVGEAKALLETPEGGANIVTGIGLYTNGINPRAVAAKWMAGTNSMMNDVRFLGGHGTAELEPSENPQCEQGWRIYNNTHTADSNISRKWNAQYPSLWITNGGGGTFVDIWTPSTFAQAGLLISNTSTPGRIYELSSEHHVRNEIMLDHAANWSIYALQTEEESGESAMALPIDIQNSSNITFANYHSYRVVSTYQPFPYAARITDSTNIRFRNFHCYSDSRASFDSAVYDQTHGVTIREREFAWLDISGKPQQKAVVTESKLTAPGAQMTRLADGFFNISGCAISPQGELYFVEPRWNTIYRWDEQGGHLAKVTGMPLEPANLAFDRSGDLLVVSTAGKDTVYALRPETGDGSLTLLKPEKSVARPGAVPILPVDVWRNENDFTEAIVAGRDWQFVAPDGSIFLPVKQDFIDNDLYWGVRMQDVVRAFGMAPARPGVPFYISDEAEEKTWRVEVGEDGSIQRPRLFAERGGEGVAVDAAGNVYLASGEIEVYDAAARLIETIAVPERPIQLLFGGKDGKTLYVLTHNALYSIRMRTKGR